MKKSICLSIVLFAMFAAMSQGNPAELVNKTVVLLPDFVNGKVVFKDGTVQQVPLNYNALFEQMIYQQNGLVMALDHISNIDTVYVDSMQFVPVDSVFYEVRLSKTATPLYIRHTCTVTKEGTSTPFGGTTQTGAVQNLASYRFDAITPYRLTVPDNYTVLHRYSLLVKQQEKYIAFKSANQLPLLFPGKEALAKKIIRQHRLGLSKQADVEMLLLYLDQQK